MSKHIILVEDDLSIQDASRLVLERKNYKITTCPDGRPLLQGKMECPDLFILDKQLPGIDGLEICRYLKSREQTRNIPVLIISASPEVCPLARMAGADAFLEKPFKIRDLRELIEKLLPS
jgi:DNA-binding response OmpR family regulator